MVTVSVVRHSGVNTQIFARCTMRRLRQAVAHPNDGKDLEKRVARLFKRLGKNRVGTNLILVDKNGHRSEIDVYYGYGSFLTQS